MATNRTDHWKLGLFVVMGVSLVFWALVWLGTSALGKKTFRVISYFNESVQGLDVGSPVKFRGVRIGRVAEIAIGPDRRHVAVISDLDLKAFEQLGFRLDAQAFLERGIAPLDLRVQLVSLGITGLKFLEVNLFDPDELESAELPFGPPSNLLPSVPSVLKSAEEGLMDLLNRAPQLETQARATLLEAQSTLETIRAAVEPFTGRDSGPSALMARLDQAARSLDAAARRLDHTLELAEVDEISTSIRSAADAVADAASETTGLGGEVRDDLVSVRELVQALRALVDDLEHDPAVLIRGRAPKNPPPGRAP